MSEPVTIDNFKPLAKLVAGYELQPGKTYLIVVDGKSFSRDLALSLFQSLRDSGADFDIHVVASLHPKGIEIRESANERESVPPGNLDQEGQ